MTLSDVNGYVSVIADRASLLSLAISGYVALTIAKVRREIAGRMTLPTIIEALEGSKDDLAAMLTDFAKNHRTFDVQLAICEANLRAVSSSGKLARPRLKALLVQIREFRGARARALDSPSDLDIERAWTIYGSLSGVIEELRRIAQIHQLGG